MPTTIKIDHSPLSSSRSASRSESSTDEELSSGSWDPIYPEDLDPSDSASHSPHPSGRRARATSASRPTRRHTTSERSSRRQPTVRVSRQAPLPPPSSVDPDDYPGYGRGYPAPQPGPYGGRMGPGYAASAFSAPGGGGYGPPPFGGALTQYGPPSGFQYPPQGNPFSPQASPVPPGGAGYFNGAPHPMSTFGAPPGHGHDLMAFHQGPGYGGYGGYHPPPGGMPPQMGYFPPHWPPGGDPSMVGDPEMEKKMLAIEEKMRTQSIDFERAKKEIEARDAAAAAAKHASEARAEADRKAKEEKDAWEKKLDEEKKAAQKQGAENARKQIEADRRKAEEKAAEEKAMADAKAAVEKAEKEAKEAVAKAEKEAKEAVAKAEKEAKETVDKALAPKDDKKKPIKFKDAVGRKFSFPFHLCATWGGMEELIRQAFLHVDGIGPLVAEGHYDLIGPNGEIILPQVWETMIEPDWSISMHMWPMPEPRIPPIGAGIDRPRSRHDHGRHGRIPVPPVSHRGAPPPPPGWLGPRPGPPGMAMPGLGPGGRMGGGLGSGPGPGPGATPLILNVAPKPSRKKGESSKSVLGWMAGKPSKSSSGKGPKKAERQAGCMIM